MSVVGKSYLIPLVKGRSDLLRIPEQLVSDLGIQAPLTSTATKPDGRPLLVRINPVDRTITIDGLERWLRAGRDQYVKSIRLEVTQVEPYVFAVELSDQIPGPVDEVKGTKISRPREGLYMGRRLEPEFFELIGTNEPVVIDESDLLRQSFICGTNGSGKTVLAKVLIEEVVRRGIPVIAIDLKGDISSIALLFSGQDSSELVPWVTPTRDESREAKAAKVAERHKANLERWGLHHQEVEEFKKNVAVNVFTPRSNEGFRLALSAFVEPPEDVERLKEEDPDAFENVIHFMAETFVSRLNLNRKRAEKTRGYVHEIIKTCWRQGESLRGYEGIKRVLDEVRLGQLGIEEIGGMPTTEFISQKDRQEISAAINALLTGAQKLWFQGFPVDIEAMVEPRNYDGKIPITVINIKHLGFQDQAYVVGYVAYLIWFWMRRRKGSDYPTLLFYIDEIGGGGSKEAFFPPVANSPSKPALNQLLRQGRAFGVCCMFATQEPGDIAHKAFGECGTLAVGQLRAKRERQKIEQVASISEVDFEAASQHLPTLGTGQFVIRTPSTQWTILEERWLMHLHRVLSQEDIKRLKEDYERAVSDLFEEARDYTNSKSLSTARNILESIINGYRFSALCTRAYLLLGTVLYDMSEYEIAINKLDEMIKYRMDAEEIGEANFLIGKCKEQQGSFVDAAASFRKVAESAASEELKTSASAHEQYCTNRAMWSELTHVEKLFWWIVGKKPDASLLIRLQIKDKDFLEEQFQTMLHERDFSIPDPIDFQELTEAKGRAAAEQIERNAEQIKAERWASDQVPKIEALLQQDLLDEAFSTCRRVVQRLKDTGGCAAPSLILAFEKCHRCREEKSQALDRKVLMLDARQFEFEMANLFRLKGYNSSATRITRDDGVDVFATRGGEKVLIQCKRWNAPVGRSKVDELAGVRERYRAHRAILATTSTFSSDAIRAARENRIELWDSCKIHREWRAALTASGKAGEGA